MSAASAGSVEQTEVVVIGGGIVGVTMALFLARAGVPVILCEKGRVACEQSSRNWGWIRKQGRDPRELPLILHGFDLWNRLVRELDIDIGWHVGGVAYLATDEARMAGFARWLVHARAHGLDSRLLTSVETDALLGRDDGRFVGALVTPSDARAEPGLAVPAMARLARREGAVIHERRAVRTIERRAGRATGVITETGRIACNAVVLAGGAWSRVLLRHLGLDLPQQQVKASVLRTAPAPAITEGAIGAPAAAIRRRKDGGYTIARGGSGTFDVTPTALRDLPLFRRALRLEAATMRFRLGRAFFDDLRPARWDDDRESPFERTRVLDPPPDRALLEEVLEAAVDLHPRLAGVRSVGSWAGMIDVLPDTLPVIDTLGGLPGLVVATGFSGHGFGTGPAAGHAAAALVTGREPEVDLRPFTFARFADGSAIVPYAWS